MKILSLNGLLGSLVVALLAAIMVTPVFSDPCGMVPPIYTGQGSPIERIGLQQTYVFYDKGFESFVIRPGFRGKVDNFGMLIPFPSPPALRKVPDTVFEQICAAIDPPEVVVDLSPKLEMMAMADGAPGGFGGGGIDFERRKNKVTVLKEEAVGMYEVAVLEAGSPEALKKWMDKNKYQYPKGMDEVTEDYIKAGWCFVAVKTKVGAKSDADPRPGQRNAQPEMPDGSVFDGNVQGLGFRFKTDELVVPMRLSAFNDGELRNVVYLLSQGGKKIQAIPEEYVVRQVSGIELVANLVKPLPLRVIGGTAKDIPAGRRQSLKAERDPTPHNGVAKQIFASDIAATSVEGFSLKHEEDEKELFRIGERLGLRGPDYDKHVEAVSVEDSAKLVNNALADLKQLTLTVVDGDFPREIIANQNLKFADFKMAGGRNLAKFYDAKIHAPAVERAGNLISSSESLDQIWERESSFASAVIAPRFVYVTLGLAGLLLLGVQVIQRRQT